jgi:hypothetical protein
MVCIDATNGGYNVFVWVDDRGYEDVERVKKGEISDDIYDIFVLVCCYPPETEIICSAAF